MHLGIQRYKGSQQTHPNLINPTNNEDRSTDTRSWEYHNGSLQSSERDWNSRTLQFALLAPHMARAYENMIKIYLPR